MEKWKRSRLIGEQDAAYCAPGLWLILQPHPGLGRVKIGSGGSVRVGGEATGQQDEEL